MVKSSEKRNLNKQITRMGTFVNLNSLIIILIIIMLATSMFFKIFCRIISENAANHLSYQLTDELKNNSNIDEETYKRIGISYVFIKYKKYNFNIGNSSENKLIMPEKMPHLTIQYKIFKDNELVYDSLKATGNGYENLASSLAGITEIVNQTSRSKVVSNKDNAVYDIEVKFNEYLVVFVFLVVMILCILSFIISIFISKLTIRTLTKIIMKPLGVLEKKMGDIASGDLDTAMKTEITFEKPIYEVEALAGHTNLILSRMHQYVDALANQNQQLKNIFDNVEQGFLIFKEDLIIHSEYSLECEKFFGEKISGEKLSTLLYPCNVSMMSFVDELFIKIFNSKHSDREVYLSLLPEEVKLNKRDLEISYKFVKDEKNIDILMVIINDISEKKILERGVEEERNILNMVVKTIINREEFIVLSKEYKEFACQDFKHLTEESYDDILRQIHTFKGNFSQYDMINLVSNLNQLEDILYGGNWSLGISKIDNKELSSWLLKDMDIIEKYLGKDIFDDDEIFRIREQRLIEVENKIGEILPENQAKKAQEVINKLRYKSIKYLLKTYPDYVLKLSERLGKNIAIFSIEGDDLMIDADYYKQVIRNLTHVFRNSVDHGIETEDERLDQGKEIIGCIYCRVIDLEHSFEICIGDDGRGIDEEALEKKAREIGIYNEGKEDKLHLIFSHGITTKKEADLVSGRGVGLSALKESVEDVNGEIRVKSHKGVGTEIVITLPKNYICDEETIYPEEFMSILSETTKEIIASQGKIQLYNDNTCIDNVLILKDYTSFIDVRGDLRALVILSINESMAKRLVNGFIIESVSAEEISKYFSEVLGEISNNILGDAFGKLEKKNGNLIMNSPFVIKSKEACINKLQTMVISNTLICDKDELSINLVLS